jgi:hypothetical protein
MRRLGSPHILQNNHIIPQKKEEIRIEERGKQTWNTGDTNETNEMYWTKHALHMDNY